MADSISSKVGQAEVNVVGGALKTYKVAIRGTEPQLSCCYHPYSPEALYCSSPVWITTLLLNLTFLPSWT